MIIGGLGSLWGTLVGGIVLGVAQTVGTQIAFSAGISPGWGGILAGHLVFLAVLADAADGPLRSIGGVVSERSFSVVRHDPSQPCRHGRGHRRARGPRHGAVLGVVGQSSTRSSTRSPCSRSHRCGTSSPATRVSSRSVSRRYIGLGAYGLFVLGDKAGLHPFLAVLVAALAATVIAVPTAGLAFRLRGGYFAIGTWVIAEVYRLVIANNAELGSGTGTTVSSAAELGRAARDNGAYWLALAAGVGAVLVVYLILRSRLGLALTAIRDNETGAQSLGVDVLRAKVIVYLVAAFGCAFAGGVVYLNLLRIQPDAAFTVNWTVYMIFIVVVGGIGTIEGPILGTAVFFVLQELLADYGVWYLIALGAVAVIVMLWAPAGCGACSPAGSTSPLPGAATASDRACPGARRGRYARRPANVGSPATPRASRP